MYLPARTPTVALAGNPNTGKTTLFNRLTGLKARVGNYPGVTVEREVGRLKCPKAGTVELLDVPGTYSLTARSAEEQIAIAAVCGLHPLDRPDVVVAVVDATQLSRNLYLVLQLIETEVPVVVALNMVDALGPLGLSIDASALARVLGVPVVPVSAQKATGMYELVCAVDQVLADPTRGRPGSHWLPRNAALEADLAAVAAHLPERWSVGEPRRRQALALWALLSLDEHDEIADAPPALRAAVIARRALAAAAGRELEREVISARYGWIDRHLPELLVAARQQGPSLTDRVDRVLLHPTVGFAIFLLVMGLVFQALFSGADPLVGLIEAGVGWLKGLAGERLPPGLFADFVQGAVIEGVGSVIVFLPQIMLLFLFIGVLEDSGYMSRVAMLMDRLMKSIGLHGRAFVPMMSGFACAVPAVLATRTMERQRDRMLTMMVVPLMTCSARLPVYTLLIGALFPPRKAGLPVQGLLMVGMYLFSVVVALGVAAVLGRTVFKGKRVPLLLELPPYRMPSLRSVLAMVWRKSKVFLVEAGTLILLVTALMWALLTFPRSDARDARYAQQRAEVVARVTDSAARAEALAALDHAQEAEALQNSYGGTLGRGLEPVIRPLGFDWKIGVGLMGAFAAREIFVSTLGVVYGMGKEVDDESAGLRERLRTEAGVDGRAAYPPLVGLALMVFFAIACQCTSTLAVVRRETRSLRWPAFLFGYTFALAWVAAFVVYQGGRLLGF